MTTGQKVGITIGALLLAGGIGFGIYAATKKKVVVPPADNGNQGGGGSSGGGSTTSGGNKLTNAISRLIELANIIQSYTAESFPLKPGMRGPNVRAMQDALRGKFNQLNVSSDGMFGVNTAKAVYNIGYSSGYVPSVSQDDFNKIIAGVKK